MPTLSELKTEYEENLRLECRNSVKREKVKDSFFEKYRHSDEEDYIEEKRKKSNAYLAYVKYITGEKKTMKERLEKLDNEIAYNRFFLSYERRASRELSRSGSRCSTPETRYRVSRIRELEDEKARLIKNSPEAFTVYYEDKLLKDLSDSSRGRLVDVPYVLNARRKIAEALEAGIPVYLVGDLGSGKTQLAEEAAIDYSIKNHIQEDMERAMESWYKKNKDAEEEEAVKYFSIKYSERESYYRDLLHKGEGEKSERLRPLFISGSHNLTYEDMFVEKSLKLEKSLGDFSYTDYLNKMISSFMKWMNEHREDMEQLTEEEQLQLKVETWHTFSNLFMAGNSNFGTVVEKIDREILIALKQGRPVIIDEMNTIAMQNLIALNDILQRHVGSTAYVTGVGPVKIQPGFCFIGTGNLSSDTVNYEGTNVLNPAFQSRFMTIEYNYIPQNTTGGIYDQKKPEENELFRVIIEYLCDKEGRLTLPGPIHTLDELFRFAQFARKSQDIFEGRNEEDNDEEKAEEAPVLNEAVLSIRNILHVLDHWNYGEEEDLSTAIWEAFISCVTNPDDLNFLLALAVRYGFFPEKDGWKIKARAKGAAAATINDIKKEQVPYLPGHYETLSRLDVIHLIFGKEPERKTVPYELKPFIKDGEEGRLSLDDYETLSKSLSHLEHSGDIFKYIEQNSRRDVL